MAPYEEDTWQVGREREDKKELNIFFQNILEKKKKKGKEKGERKFPLTCLKSNPLEDQFVGGVEERKQKEKGKRKSENKGKSQKKNEREERN